MKIRKKFIIIIVIPLVLLISFIVSSKIKESNREGDRFLTDIWKTYKTEKYLINYLEGPLAGKVQINKYGKILH